MSFFQGGSKGSSAHLLGFSSGGNLDAAPRECGLDDEFGVAIFPLHPGDLKKTNSSPGLPVSI